MVKNGFFSKISFHFQNMHVLWSSMHLKYYTLSRSLEISSMYEDALKGKFVIYSKKYHQKVTKSLVLGNTSHTCWPPPIQNMFKSQVSIVLTFCVYPFMSLKDSRVLKIKFCLPSKNQWANFLYKSSIFKKFNRSSSLCQI